jgi:hypothetical protein
MLRSRRTRKRVIRLDGEVAGLFLFDLGLGLCFTVLLTAPAVRFFNTHIFGYPHDGFAYMWRMWWTRKALLDLRVTPAQMSYINYPHLAYNPHLIASPLINLLALPFVSLLGPLRVYNALLFLSFALSWPTGALLCREFTHERLSASVGGALYAFHANRVAHAIGGHLPHVFTFLFPLMALLLYRVWRTPGRRHALWAGLVLALVLLIDLKHVALFVAPFVAVFLVFFGLCERHLWTRERLLALAIAFGVGALIVVPFFVSLVIERLRGQLGYFYAPGVIRHSADLLGFIVPSPEHPLYRQIPGLYAVAERLALPGWHENIFYLGWVSVVLAVVGTVVRWRQLETRFWAVTALVGVVLALGPVLKVNGEVLSWNLGQTTGVIPFPYALLQALPFYDWGRTPGRMVTLAMLALAVLTALGSATVLTRLRARVLRAPMALLLIILVVGDHIFTWPWPLGDAEVPAFYDAVAAQPADFAILDLPLWEYRCERYQLYYATAHGHRIVGGSITRRSPEAEEMMRQVEQWALPHADGQSGLELAKLGVRYVVLHKLCLEEPALDEQTAFLTAQLGSPVYDDRWIRAFEVPGQPTISRR